MNPHAEVKLSISDIAFGGSGVARHDGKVFFVPFTIADEVVDRPSCCDPRRISPRRN